MAKGSLFTLIEAIVVVFGGTFLILGLWPPGNMGFQIIGIVASFIGLGLTILITAGAEGEEDVDDITLVNARLNYAPMTIATALAVYTDSMPLMLGLAAYVCFKAAETFVRVQQFNSIKRNYKPIETFECLMEEREEKLPTGSVLGGLLSVPIRKYLKVLWILFNT